MTEFAEISPAIEDSLRTAQRVVVLTGAGVSKESGLATFRGAGGLWEKHRAAELATPEAFDRQPERVWSWYVWRYLGVAASRPNLAHLALSRFPELFPFFTLVTQNVDGLHQEAGSQFVLELHGTLRRARCERCGDTMPMSEAVEQSPDRPPLCPCGGRFRPDVVWFGEPLPEDVFARAQAAAEDCDLFIVAGTSGTVFPAAGLIDIAHRAGALVVEINPEKTEFSRRAGFRLAAPAGAALPAFVEVLERCRQPTS